MRPDYAGLSDAWVGRIASLYGTTGHSEVDWRVEIERAAVVMTRAFDPMRVDELRPAVETQGAASGAGSSAQNGHAPHREDLIARRRGDGTALLYSEDG